MAIKTIDEVIELIPQDDRQICGEVIGVGKDQLLKSYRQLQHTLNYMNRRLSQVSGLNAALNNKLTDNDFINKFDLFTAVTKQYFGSSQEYDDNMSITYRVLNKEVRLQYAYNREIAELGKWGGFLLESLGDPNDAYDSEQPTIATQYNKFDEIKSKFDG